MRNKVVKKTVVIGAITLALTGISGFGVSAEWKQNKDDNTWSWIENDLQVTGWRLIKGTWYYFNDDGNMITGWNFNDGNWYYFNNDGSMHIGWLKNNEKWYKLSENGSMITGWIFDAGKWYYAKSSGDLETTSITIDGKKYDFLSNGELIEDTQTVDFGINDVLAINTSIPEKDGNHNKSDEYKSEEIKEDPKEDEEESKEETHEMIKNDFIQRTDEPGLYDKHYYSNDNIFYSVKLSPPFKKSDGTPIKGNCTWYAWGRAWEITGKKPVEAGFTGNAYEWWQANKSSKKYKYGSEPKVGSLAVWNSSLPGSGGCGHVAIVEKIENGKIYISESMWHGDCFAYKPIYSTQYLLGYIYLDEPNY